MSSLYQITEQLAALDQLLEQAGGDITEGSGGETLEKWLTEYEWQQREKIDAYCGFIRNMESDMEAIDAEVKRLNDRKRVLYNRVERLMALMKKAMEMRQVRRLEGVKFSAAIQKNGGKDPIEILVDDVNKYPEYLVKVIRQLDKEAIRKALESNDPDAEKLARIGERGESVRIR